MNGDPVTPLSEDPVATEDGAGKKGVIELSGRQIVLDSGAVVWGGWHDDCVVWTFTHESGGRTTVKLSKEAMNAVMNIWQTLNGCDKTFVEIMLQRATEFLAGGVK